MVYKTAMGVLIALILLMVLMVSLSPAHAQFAGAGASSGSAAQSAAGANSGAAAGAAINQTFASPPASTYGLSESKILNTPNVINSNIYPTAPCAHSTSGGVGVPGFGISLGSSHIDDDCTRRETARMFHGMGMNTDAIAVLCATPVAQVAPACQKLAPARKADVPPAVRDGDRARRDGIVQSPDGRYWTKSASGEWVAAK